MHTQAPWAIETDHDEDIEDTVLIHGAADAPGTCPVALVYTADAFPCVEDEDRAQFEAECKANARLIAAAPELLNVCIGILECLDEKYRWTSVSRKFAAVSLRAAIAKARGE